MENNKAAIAMLLFRVGPVHCCAPADPVQTIIAPQKLTHPPGTSEAQPGIFYHADHVVKVSELRHRFGVPVEEREQPGRLIITQSRGEFIAYWVDEIIEVIDTPEEGWGEKPSFLPDGVFSKTLLLNDKIYLFTSFSDFENLPENNYLNRYFASLEGGNPETIQSTPEPEDTVASSGAEKQTTPNSDETSEAIATQQAMDTQASTEDIPEHEQTKPESVQEQTDSTADSVSNDIAQTPVPETRKTDLPDEQADDWGDYNNSSAEPAGTEEEITPLETSTTQTENVEEKFTETNVNDEPATEEPVGQIQIEEAEPETDPQEQTSTPASQENTVQLKPVPSVVPESEQPEKKSVLPVIVIAASVLLFVLLAAGTGYYFLSSSDETSPAPAVQTETLSPEPVTQEIQTPDDAVEPEQQTATSQDSTDEQETEQPSTNEESTEHQQTNESTGNDDSQAADETSQQEQTEKNSESAEKSDYRAEIKPDDEGVTIVLHSPEQKPVLRGQSDKTEQPETDETKSPATRNKNRPTGKEEIIHIVVKGDTLWAIAKHYVNDPYKYPQLASLSKIKNPDRIYPGNRVRILRHHGKQDE